MAALQSRGCRADDFINFVFLILQGVFINPALVEPFGLTIIEVKSKHNIQICLRYLMLNFIV